MTAKVFISHSSGDQKVARTICTALEHRGLVCWMATRDVGPGQNYMDAIVRAIRDAKVMVLVFSQNANISSEILKELSLASKYKVNVIPARIEDVVPSEAFELEFATRQWIDLFDDWEREIDRLTSWIIGIVSIEPKTDAPEKRAGTAPTPKLRPTPIIERRPELVKSDAETLTVEKDEQPLLSDSATRLQTAPPLKELGDIKEAEARREADEEHARREAEARRLAEEEERRKKEEERRKNAEAVARERAEEETRRREAAADAERRAEDERGRQDAEAKQREDEQKRRRQSESGALRRAQGGRESTTAESQVRGAHQPESSPVALPGRMKLKPIYLGGAVLAIIGLVWGGWIVAAQMAEEKAKEAADSARVAAQAEICADRFKRDDDWWAKLTELKKLAAWEQGEFIRKGGWADDYRVASDCAELLRHYAPYGSAK